MNIKLQSWKPRYETFRFRFRSVPLECSKISIEITLAGKTTIRAKVVKKVQKVTYSQYLSS